MTNIFLKKNAYNLFIAKFFDDVELIDIVETVIACRDRKDDKFLELAVNGRADYIITGDQDLLVLHPFAGAIAKFLSRDIKRSPIHTSNFIRIDSH